MTSVAQAFDHTATSGLHPVSAPIVAVIEPELAPAIVPIATIARPHGQAGPPLTLLARHCALLL